MIWGVVYGLITLALFTLLFVVYLTDKELDGQERKEVARCILGVPLWPLALIALICWGIYALFAKVGGLFEDADLRGIAQEIRESSKKDKVE